MGADTAKRIVDPKYYGNSQVTCWTIAGFAPGRGLLTFTQLNTMHAYMIYCGENAPCCNRARNMTIGGSDTTDAAAPCIGVLCSTVACTNGRFLLRKGTPCSNIKTFNFCYSRRGLSPVLATNRFSSCGNEATARNTCPPFPLPCPRHPHAFLLANDVPGRNGGGVGGNSTPWL